MKLLNEKEASQVLNISRTKLGQLRRDGLGPPYILIGGSVRYRLEALEAWVELQERDAS